MTKLCSCCKQELSIALFSKRKTGLQANCKECNKTYHKEHYKQNKSAYLKKNKGRKQELAKFIEELKDNKRCKDCNKKFRHFVLDFDHLPGNKKISNISDLRRSSKEKLLEEIKKCELVCANCHRTRTYNRAHSSTS